MDYGVLKWTFMKLFEKLSFKVIISCIKCYVICNMILLEEEFSTKFWRRQIFCLINYWFFMGEAEIDFFTTKPFPWMNLYACSLSIPQDSRLTCAPTPAVKPSHSACLTTGRPWTTTQWTQPPSLESSSRRPGNERVSPRAYQPWTNSSTKCNPISANNPSLSQMIIL